jgi:hypothetical protein
MKLPALCLPAVGRGGASRNDLFFHIVPLGPAYPGISGTGHAPAK